MYIHVHTTYTHILTHSRTHIHTHTHTQNSQTHITRSPHSLTERIDIYSYLPYKVPLRYLVFYLIALLYSFLSKVFDTARRIHCKRSMTLCILLTYILCTALAEQLVSEVKRLQQELAITKSKLQSASEMISKMPSEGRGIIPCSS